MKLENPLVAVVREPGDDLDRCALTHLERATIDVPRAREQHRAYRDALTKLGAAVVTLPPLAGFPDAVFVEDVAVVLDEIAVVTNPGAESRRGETESIVPLLGAWRDVVRMEADEPLDGGDVLRIGRRLYVGRSSRTDAAGVSALERLVAPHGYDVISVPVKGALHLKTAATALDEETLLVNPEWIEAEALHEDGVFGTYRALTVPGSEPFAANTLALPGSVLVPEEHPRTASMLREHGFRIETTPYSELAKAEAGLTCASLIFEALPRDENSDAPFGSR